MFGAQESKVLQKQKGGRDILPSDTSAQHSGAGNVALRPRRRPHGTIVLILKSEKHLEEYKQKMLGISVDKIILRDILKDLNEKQINYIHEEDSKDGHSLSEFI